MVPTILKNVYWNALEKLAAARLKSASITKHEFINDIGNAIAARQGLCRCKDWDLTKTLDVL